MERVIFLMDLIAASLTLGYSLLALKDGNYSAALGWFVASVALVQISVYEGKSQQ